MSKLQYVGSGKEDPVKVKIYGYEFDLNGEPVEVTDEKIAKKLSGNPTFKLIGAKTCGEQLEDASKNDFRKDDGKFTPAPKKGKDDGKFTPAPKKGKDDGKFTPAPKKGKK
jgi:hypothetical protein